MPQYKYSKFNQSKLTMFADLSFCVTVLNAFHG